MLRGVEGSGRRQELLGERSQQMRLAVEQIRQRPRAQRPGGKIGHAAPGIGNAGRPSVRIAGASLRKPPAPVAHARQKRIRTKSLKFHDFSSRKQAVTGRRRRFGNNFSASAGLRDK
jgi:hypothetical protein